MTDKTVVLSACSSEEEARRIARKLVETRLAACVSIVPRARSIYRWKGEIEEAEECLLVIKTSRNLFDRLRQDLEKAHTYEVPEVVALAVVAGSPNYSELARSRIGRGRSMKIAPGISLIFDMDGVIIDSNFLHREAWQVYNRRFGIETTEAMQRRMYGRRNDEIVRDFFGEGLSEEEIAEHGAAKERLYREMMAPLLQQSLVPGVAQFLQERNGAPTGVGSNAERANIDFVLDGVRIGDTPLRRCFSAVVDGGQVNRPKPAPDVYLRAAQLLGSDPRNCVVFEDSVAGVEAALAAGARVAAICTTDREFKNIGVAVDDFRSPELKAWLEAQKPAV